MTQPETARSDQAALDEVLTDTGALVQQFVDEIETDGEWSLVFFDGAFSHAVIKRPLAGDFRVQEDFGGSAEARMPPRRVVEAAAYALRQVPGSPSTREWTASSRGRVHADGDGADRAIVVSGQRSGRRWIGSLRPYCGDFEVRSSHKFVVRRSN